MKRDLNPTLLQIIENVDLFGTNTTDNMDYITLCSRSLAFKKESSNLYDTSQCQSKKAHSHTINQGYPKSLGHHQ